MLLMIVQMSTAKKTKSKVAVPFFTIKDTTEADSLTYSSTRAKMTENIENRSVEIPFNASLNTTIENASGKTPANAPVDEASLFEEIISCLYKRYDLVRIIGTRSLPPGMTLVDFIFSLESMFAPIYKDAMGMLSLYLSCKPIGRFVRRKLCTAMRAIINRI